MPVLRMGLVLATLACVYVAWASWSSGYHPEVALLRGLVAFVAFSLLAYIGELAVATAPPEVQTPQRNPFVLPGRAQSADEDKEEDGLPRAA